MGKYTVLPAKQLSSRLNLVMKEQNQLQEPRVVHYLDGLLEVRPGLLSEE